MKKITAKTGEIVKVSGQYQAIGRTTEVTFVEGKRVPPTPDGAATFVLIDTTKHNGGK